MGIFNNNVAKSNGDSGLIFHHHESGEQVLLEKTKALKNRYKGLYMYWSYNMTFLDSLFAENSQFNMEMRWVDNVHIQDTVIRGYTSETKALVEPPYFNEPCVSPSFYTSIGIKIPTQITSWDRTNNIGATLTNVLFTNFDHSGECEASIPITFNSNDNYYNHFNYLTMFQNVTVDGTKIMDASSSDQEGVKDIVVHDIDGSSDPLGQASQGMFVSNVNRLTAFAEKGCIMYPQGISYCAESCYRTVTFMVDQSSSNDYDLRVTRQTDGEEAIVPFTYKYDDDDDYNLKHFADQYRYFTVSLPMGSYKLEFVKDLQPVWPSFVLPRWEGIPECEGYVFKADITVVEPSSVSCNELIVNGDMEQGIHHWLHRNWRGNPIHGALVAARYEGINNSTAVRHYNRDSGYAGIGQNLDTRCLHQSLDEFYEIQLYFRLENNTSPFICNPFSGSWEDHCPYITFQQQRYVDGKIDYKYTGRRANTIVPNDIGDFNLVHGVFKVDESIHALERLFMYLEFAHQDFDMIVDNVSVKKLPVICGEDLVRNGDFDGNGKFWRRYGNALIDIENVPNNNLKVFNKVNADEGAYQDLYIDKACFLKDQRFQITGKFLVSRFNITLYESCPLLKCCCLSCGAIVLYRQI